MDRKYPSFEIFLALFGIQIQIALCDSYLCTLKHIEFRIIDSTCFLNIRSGFFFILATVNMVYLLWFFLQSYGWRTVNYREEMLKFWGKVNQFLDQYVGDLSISLNDDQSEE